MPLQLGSITSLLHWAPHKQHDESAVAHIRCLPVCKGGRQAIGEDTVKRLMIDVDQLGAQASPNCQQAQDLMHEKMRRQLSDDVQKQLHHVLEVIKELTAEKGGRACQKHTPHEAVELLEQFVALDLPVQLLAEIPLLCFEARKDVMNVCCALLWPGMPQHVDRQMVQYLQHHPRAFPVLVAGYEHEETALHCGVVLRSFARHAELVEAFLGSRLVFNLLRLTRHPGVDISSDAFYTLREMLLCHKEVSARWLQENFQDFFSLYNEMLRTQDYFQQRQALDLLASMLLDRSFKPVMLAYVKDARHLKINMNLLRDSSKVVRFEAFQVFKIFAADPQKPRPVHQILYQNRDRLVELLRELEAFGTDDVKERFSTDQRAVVGKLQALQAPPAPAQAAARRPAPGA